MSKQEKIALLINEMELEDRLGERAAKEGSQGSAIRHACRAMDIQWQLHDLVEQDLTNK